MKDQNQSNNQNQINLPKMRFSSLKAKKQAIKNQLALLTFIDDLIKEKKDPSINEKNIAEVRTILLNELNKAINIHLISLLTEKDQKDLEALLDTNPPDDVIDDFFVKRIPNFEEEVAVVLLNFRSAYLYSKLIQTQKEEKAKNN